LHERDREDLSARLVEAERRIATLESRVSILDGGEHEGWDETVGAAEPGLRGSSEGGEGAHPRLLALLGRTFLILSGAFLIRATTDAGILPSSLGVALGLIYGVGWLWFASRTASEHPRAATFFALATALICFPLLYEATLQFKILTPSATVVLLLAVWGLGAAVSFREHLRIGAWLFSVGAGTTGLALTFGGGFWVPYCFAVLGMALSGLWLGYLRGWSGLAVVGTAVADAVVISLTLLNILRPTGVDVAQLELVPLLALQLGLVALFVGSYLLRALVFNSHISAFDIMQAATAMVIGFGGALQTATGMEQGGWVVGAFAALTAVFGYSVTFRYLDRGTEYRRNFGFFTTAALTTSIIGAALLLSGIALTAFLLTIGLVSAWIGTRSRRATLSMHGSTYTIAAAFSSGLLTHALRAVVGSPELLPPSSQLLPMVAVFVVAALSFLAPVAETGRTWGSWSRAPKVLYTAVLAFGSVGFIASAAGTFLMPAVSESWQGPVFDAWRTGGFSVTAMILAMLSRARRVREAGMLVPVFLALGGISLLLGDLRAGRPATLVISLVLFGAALILAPRIRRSRKRTDKQIA
jgi:Predicted membrane protein (DUF2339)